MTFIEVEPPHRIVAVGRGGKFNRNKTSATWTLDPDPGGGTGVEVTTETEPALPTDRLMEAVSGQRGWFKRGPQGAAPAAVDPRGGRRPRGARDGRRALDSAPRWRACSASPCRRAHRRRWPPAAAHKDGVRPQVDAETEGIYLDVDDLKYQVQMSRFLNPDDVEDSEYLRRPAGGQPAADRRRDLVRRLDAGQELDRDETLPPTTIFEIVDTQDNVYEPIPLDTEINPFAYEADRLSAPAMVMPEPDSAAGQRADPGLADALQGPRPSRCQNRPLELRFSNEGGGQEGVDDLDV